MEDKYRRFSTQEIDQGLQLRSSKEKRIDYLEWLLIQDEEALKLSFDEDDGFTYVDFNKERERYLYQSGVWEDEQQAELKRKTEQYRNAIQKRLDYWKQARSDAGPFLVEDRSYKELFENQVQEPEIIESDTQSNTLQKVRWRGNITDLVYLFLKLEELGFIGRDFKDRPWAYLENHFLSKTGKELKRLKVVKQNIKDESGKYESRASKEIDSILSKMGILEG